MGDSTSMESDGNMSRNKFIGICIVFLDDSLHQIQIGRRALGNTLYTQVINRFRVVEPEYFDLEFYTASGKQCWLERSKEVITEWKKAVHDKEKDSEERHEKSSARKSGAAELSSTDPVFYFSVKYFVPDPTQLRAENTRYLYALQIRRDLRTGQLFCSENTAALLISYIVQGDYGDFSEDFYIRARPFIRSHYKHVSLSNAASSLLNNSEFDSLEQKIATYHRMHFGMTQNDADLCILDTARKIEFYSIRLYPVKDSDSIQLAICVVHFGVLIFQNRIKINSFNWSKIKKISYKKKKFILKFRRADTSDEEPRGQDGVLETIEFTFASKEECHRFWQLAIDYHSFFRSYDITGRPAYPLATESLRKRAALLQATTEGESALLPPGGNGSQMALTQSMYVTPSTPTPSAYGFRPFGSLQRAALRRSMRQSMTPTPSVRMQPSPAAQQPNGPNVGSSVPLSRHQLAPSCTTLPSRAIFVAQQQQQMQTAAPLGRSPNGYASDTLESVRTACTSNSSGSHSLHCHDSRITLTHDAHTQRQLSLESAPAGPMRGNSSLNASAQLLSASDGQPSSQCVCCTNPEYRPLESSGYHSNSLQHSATSASCTQCGSRSLSLSQQAVAVRTPQLHPAADRQQQQTSLSNAQLTAADPAALEQFMKMSQTQVATSRSSTPHSHQLRHAHSVQHRATPTHNHSAQAQALTQAQAQAQVQMHMQMQMQMQPAPGTYYPAGQPVQPTNGSGNYTAAYPVGLLPTGPFAAGLTPAALRNSITNPSQSAVNAANQLDALAIAASQPGAPGGRVPDLSAYSSTVPVNTNTLNGRRGSAASTTGVNANANTGMNSVNAGQAQTDNRMPTGRQASPALGVSAIEAQQETRLKSFQSFRTQKMPSNSSNPRIYPASSQSPQPAAHHLTVTTTNQSDARNSASLSMTASTVSNGSDSTMPESTATGSSADTDTAKPNMFARSDIDADTDTGTPTAVETVQSSSSAANTLTRPNHSPAKHVAPATLRTNDSNGAAPVPLPPNGAAAGHHTDSAAQISPAKDDEAALLQDDNVYTPLAAVSSGFPTSPTGVVRSPSANAASSSLGATATQNAALSGNQSYSWLLLQDALCQERTYVKDLRIIAVHFADFAREHSTQFADVELELAAATRCQPQTPGMLDTLLYFFTAFYERHAALLAELQALSTAELCAQAQVQPKAQPPQGTNAFLDIYVGGARVDVEIYRSYFSYVDQLACDYFMRLVQIPAFDALVSKFDTDCKMSYLFIHDFFIKPIIHLHEYSLFLKKIENYAQLESTEQFTVSEKLLTQLGQLSATLQVSLNECNPRIQRLLRYLALLEIRKDVLFNYAPPLDRALFVRFGFIYKLSNKGFQQRMMFLFEDFLLFVNRPTKGNAADHFYARHCYALTDVHIASAGSLRISQPDVQPSIGANSFQLLVNVPPSDSRQNTRLLTLVASSELERCGWLTDLAKLISLAHQRAQTRPIDRPLSPTRTRPVSPPSVPNEDAALLSLITQVAATSLSTPQPQVSTDANREEMRSPTLSSSLVSTNSLICVCWHRGNSVSASQFSSLLESQISGYLLRKFQSSSGWQRLWSVFTKCCLFFYRTYQDESPIASLPLWGYTVAIADETDQIQKAFVFKLTYKGHKYYFRTENELAFTRWMQTLRAALLNNMQV